VPFDLQTSASRSTVFMGNAVLDACRDIRQRVLSLYAETTGVDEDVLSEAPGLLITPDGEVPLLEASRVALGALGGEFVGQGIARMRGRKGHPLGGDAAFYEFNCTAIEVEVDFETGELLLHKHVSVSDVGTELNPLQVTSQDEGASIMGLGHSQMEQLLFDDRGMVSRTTMVPARTAPRASARAPCCALRVRSDRRSATRSACPFVTCR
jgi:CO/xanthine dehydrogenase Mo-binding subunit